MNDYQRIEKAIHHIERNFQQKPSLQALADSLNLSPFHFQRLFSKWAGISPKQFLQYLTADHARTKLLESKSVLDASLEAGISSPGRLHDMLVRLDAISPGEWKRLGSGVTIQYGVHSSPFGKCLVATTERGLCGLVFLGESIMKDLLEELKQRWPNAVFQHHPKATQKTAEAIFDSKKSGKQPLKLFVKGTQFQVKVWEALLRIPQGSLVSYQAIAKTVGAPKACRAVGTAVGANPIGYLIPCHRVIRETGIVGKYRWGTARKKAMIAWESA